MDIQLHRETLSPEYCRQYVADPQAGAIVEFVGLVRQQTKGKTVLRLEFEAYEKMALSEMSRIAGQAIERYNAIKISIHHRIGVLQTGEIPVIVAVSAAHREAAFAACQYCIDTLKVTVPIWKKEVFEDGAVWVSAHP